MSDFELLTDDDKHLIASIVLRDGYCNIRIGGDKSTPDAYFSQPHGVPQWIDSRIVGLDVFKAKVHQGILFAERAERAKALSVEELLESAL